MGTTYLSLNIATAFSRSLLMLAESRRCNFSVRVLMRVKDDAKRKLIGSSQNLLRIQRDLFVFILCVPACYDLPFEVNVTTLETTSPAVATEI